MASGSSRKALPVGKIRDLTPTMRPPPLEVIVTRTWDVQVSNADTFDFILMDTDGDQIHGWIPRRLAADYDPHIFENSILRIRDFNVIEKKNKYYSPLKNQYNIVFTEHTKVEAIPEYLRFPQQPFKFTDFADLHPLVGRKSYLSDVIGMFEYLGQTRKVSSTKKLREVFIRNERDQALKITFWDGDISLTIGVNISQGTKVFVNPDIPAAAELRTKITAPSPGRPEKRLLPADAIRSIRDVRTALANGTMGFNLCKATIQQVHEDEGWKYLSCTKCRRKVTLSGNDYWCFKCNAGDHNPDERYRLQLQIGDRYGILNVTAFSEAASEILEISLKDMNAISEKPETGEEDVRAEIAKIIGREYLFRIKINDYNLKNPEKALTISSVSNVTHSQQKRMRPTTTVARQLSFSTPSAAEETTLTQISGAPTVISSQDNTIASSSGTHPAAPSMDVRVASPTLSQP